jgi:PTH1 family peptidyl-tRNA hydrolase
MDPANFVLRPFNRKEQEEVLIRMLSRNPFFFHIYLIFCSGHSTVCLRCTHLFLQLDFAFHRGLEAVRIMALEGFNKSATYVNTAQSSEMLNR